MLALFLAPVYLILCWYIWKRWTHWLKHCHLLFDKPQVKGIIGVVYLFVITSLLTSMLFPQNLFHKFLKVISNYWLGILLYILLILFIVDFLRIVLKKISFSRKEFLFSRKGCVFVGTLCLCILVLISGIGVYNASVIKTTDYEVNVNKTVENRKDLRIVLVADMHLGYNIGNLHMKQMVEKINKEKPDLVVVAGDIFDNEYAAVYQPEEIAKTLRNIKSTYGVYACYGNHDVEEKILAGFTFDDDKHKESSKEMDDFLKKAGIKLLKDEGVLIDNSFYVYGRPDAYKRGNTKKQRKSPMEITKNMDREKPIIMIDHQPKELQEMADAGVDLDLSGHTHDGQLFPGNLFVKLMWENSYGYLQKGTMHNIVTSGVGLFGPNMRVGTKSEICSILVHFNEK